MDQGELLQKTALLAQRSSSLQSMPSRLEVSPDTLSALKNECKKAAKVLAELQALLSQREPKTSEVEDLPLRIAQEKESLLIGFRKVYEDSEPLILPDDTSFQQMLLIDDLEKNVAEMNDTLAWVKAQRQHIRDNIDREAKLLKEREDIQDRLRERMDEVQAEGTKRPANESLIRALKKKEARVMKYSQKMMEYLRQFTEEHFPPLEPEDILKWKRKRSFVSGEDVFPLLDILEHLMNRSVEAPNDPYIVIDDRYWPPYLQLLVRVGIAQRHPEDDNRVKITPFHL